MTIPDIVKSENILNIQAEPQDRREMLKAVLFQRLAELNANQQVISQVKQTFRTLDKADRELADEYTKQNAIENSEVPLKFDGKGRPLITIENFLTILQNDKHFANIRLNELSHRPERYIDGHYEPWQNVDDSKTREYIETKYHIHSENKCNDAMAIAFNERKYNPVKQIIESVEWDGIPRMENLFIKWLKCEDTPYTREVTRLVFAGGIHRIYNPGCKFDDVCVLVGTKQGEGKSTFVRWLAVEDRLFAEIKNIEKKDDYEGLQGKWVCEMVELMAVTKQKEVESVKAFITTQVDRFRMSYERRTEDYPRQCFFIGTTNKRQFLVDKTGNRRWYPLTVHSVGYDIFDHEKEVKADILQCWAEAKALYDKGQLPPYAKRSLSEVITQQQDNATEDDYRIGLIEKYLQVRERVCVIELWQNALDNEFSKPSRKDSNEIALIMDNIDGWECTKKTERSDKYGIQKFWHNKNYFKPAQDDDLSDLPL